MASDADMEVDEREPEYIDVKGNRKLLNPKFDKYVISTQDLPVVKQKLFLSLRNIEPSTDQWSRQQIKIFTMVQPVFHDLLNSNESKSLFFFVDSNGGLNRTQFDFNKKNFVQLNEINLSVPILPPAETSLEKDCLPISIKFADNHIAFVADGYGRILIYKTGDRNGEGNWQFLDAFYLLGGRAPNFEHGDEVLGHPFILTDVRTLSDNKYEVLTVSVFKRSQDEIKNDPEKTGFASGIHWLSFEVDSHAKVKLIRCRRFEADGNLELATFDRFADHLIVLSGKKPSVIFDSTRNVKKIRKAVQEAAFEVIYVWRQTSEDITVLFKLPGTISKKNLKIEIKPKYLSVFNGKEKLLEGELFNEIDADESSWTVEGSQENGKQITSVEIILSKKHRSVKKWQTLVPDDKRGKEIVEIVEQPAHIPVEENTLNPNHLEDVDMTADDELSFLTWINGESDQVDKCANLSFHQILFTQQLEFNAPIGLCIREDVDGIFYDFSHSPIKHKFTLDAFGYVQAGKTSRRFTLCSPNGNIATVVDRRNHAYIYYKGSDIGGSTLTNTKDKKQVVVAKQFVVSLISVDVDYQSGKYGQDILAAIAMDKFLFLATESCFYVSCVE